MHKNYAIRNGKVVETTEADGKILIYTSVDESERHYLIDTLKIDEHTLGSALDPEEVGRLEFEPEHTAIIFKRPKRYTAADNFLFKVTTCGFFLFEDRLIMVTEEEMMPFEGRHFARVSTVTDFFFRLLYQNILHFTEHLKVMNNICDKIG
ncbi:MAG: magnesium transporter, partial [Candidatus Hydrogenedentes bacterium]|nr:magnesium transporter [Candidatus Hydrogenedentota bacterium]